MIERVVVITDDAVESGGAAGIALRSVRMLSARGIAVTVLNGSEAPANGLSGVDIVSLGARNLLQGARAGAALRGFFSRPAMRFVANWIAAHDTPGTIYHLHNWHKVLSPSIFVPLRQVAGRLFMTAHDYFLVCPNGGQFHYPDDAVCERVPLSVGCVATNCDRRHYAHKLWRVGRHLVRSAAFDLAATQASVVAVHDGMVPYLRRGGVAPANIVVLRNPVVPWVGRRVLAEQNREVLFVGRLEKDKGVDVVAAAAREADLPLRIVGGGPLAEELGRDYPEAAMMGRRPPSEIAEMAASARIVVVPTRWRETFGLVTLEAVMSGIPVLVSRNALIADEVSGLGCAEICDPGDRAALARQLRRLARDDRAVQRMSEYGFERGRTLSPTPDAWCDALIAHYRDKLTSLAVSESSRSGIDPGLRPETYRAQASGSARQ